MVQIKQEPFLEYTVFEDQDGGVWIYSLDRHVAYLILKHGKWRLVGIGGRVHGLKYNSLQEAVDAVIKKERKFSFTKRQEQFIERMIEHGQKFLNLV